MTKPTPGYWWDFRHNEDGSLVVVVESDVSGFVERECATVQDAEKEVCALREGRSDPRRPWRNS